MISNILTGILFIAVILLILIALTLIASWAPTIVGTILIVIFFIAVAAWLGDAINNG